MAEVDSAEVDSADVDATGADVTGVDVCVDVCVVVGVIGEDDAVVGGVDDVWVVVEDGAAVDGDGADGEVARVVAAIVDWVVAGDRGTGALRTGGATICGTGAGRSCGGSCGRIGGIIGTGTTAGAGAGCAGASGAGAGAGACGTNVAAGAAGATARGVTKTVRGASCTTGTGFVIVSCSAETGGVLDTAAFPPGPGR